jgi:hypothetical protein
MMVNEKNRPAPPPPELGNDVVVFNVDAVPWLIELL